MPSIIRIPLNPSGLYQGNSISKTRETIITDRTPGRLPGLAVTFSEAFTRVFIAKPLIRFRFMTDCRVAADSAFVIGHIEELVPCCQK